MTRSDPQLTLPGIKPLRQTIDRSTHGASEDFVPAKSKVEVVARLYALAGVPGEGLGPGSKERKSVLTSVADRLSLDVDTSAAKDLLAVEMLRALGEPADDSYTSTGQTITLAGLNAVLRGAERELRVRAARQLRSTRPEFPDWFTPARDKLEAVRRISSLCGGRPQELGPGSKERKSVLTDLVTNLDLPIDTSLAKDRLAGAISQHFGIPWTDTCWSKGQTITLDGLNAVLAGAESATIRGHLGAHARLLQEAQLLVAALAKASPRHWDGRSCVTEMLAADYPKARQTEWFGWYYEFIGLPALINAYGGGPRRIGATEFDYARSFVWDLKAHAEPGLSSPHDAGGDAPLNDHESILECVEKTGSIGFLVLSGSSVMDEDASFDDWHRAMRGTTKPRTAKSRVLKRAFTPVSFDAYVFEGPQGVEIALEQKVLKVFRQGHQPDGSPRKPKLMMSLGRAREAGYVMASAAPSGTPGNP